MATTYNISSLEKAFDGGKSYRDAAIENAQKWLDEGRETMTPEEVRRLERLLERGEEPLPDSGSVPSPVPDGAGR